MDGRSYMQIHRSQTLYTHRLLALTAPISAGPVPGHAQPQRRTFADQFWVRLKILTKLAHHKQQHTALLTVVCDRFQEVDHLTQERQEDSSDEEDSTEGGEWAWTDDKTVVSIAMTA